MIVDVGYDTDSKQLNYLEVSSPYKCLGNELLFYDTLEFHNYHQHIVERVYRLLITTNGKELGSCYIGQRDSVLCIPYSAPFSLVYVKMGCCVEQLCLFARSLVQVASLLGCAEVRMTLPPEIYAPDLVPPLCAAFFSEGFEVRTVDINQHFDLASFADRTSYLTGVRAMHRKNYKKASANGLRFEELSIGEYVRAYSVIEANRKEHGYPLKISREHMCDLVSMSAPNARCFVVIKSELTVAAAIIFDINANISQVIYWGDLATHRAERPMALLSVELLATYKQSGKRFLDIGPSSERGIVNLGLANFKTAIGCSSGLKFTLARKIEQ